MDMPRSPSSASTPLSDQIPLPDRPRSANTPQARSPSPPPKGAMNIPSAQLDHAPPPLPPPQFPPFLANGHDFANQTAHTRSRRPPQKSTLAPIRQGSSLAGAYTAQRLHTKIKLEDPRPEDQEMPEADRRSNTQSTHASLSHADQQVSQEDRAETPSPSTIANQRLQGEKPLVQQSFQHSAEAYDKHLLSKIGKSNSPPQHPSVASRGASAAATSHADHAQDGSIPQRRAVGDPSAPNYHDPVSRYMATAASAGPPHAGRPAWRDAGEYRSSSVDSSAPSSAPDPDHHARLGDLSRHSIGGSRPTPDDAAAAMLTDSETCFPMEETGDMRKLNLVDRTPPHHSAHRRPPAKQQGQKRRAPSPPSASGRDDKTAVNGANPIAEMHPRPATGQSYSRSPKSRLHPSHGSISSTSSAGLRNGSYASSVGLSMAGSSMTSISSLERLSPRETPPSSELEASQGGSLVHHPASLTSVAPYASHHRPAPSSLSLNPPESRSAGLARAMSAHVGVGDGRSGTAPRLTGAFMCECCPKKPKKFENEEDLRMHMLEKQYQCAYCHNRFKNKNEAERHQNSLHLRRHSWSCAAISGYESAFHPSTAPASQTPNGPSRDACGYCGEEFSNLPRDWEVRIEHLTNVHRFRECSQTKKFFRADHFRQHLKHSHAGTSGKWTNMLENACMKDEPAAAPGSPAAPVLEPGTMVPPSAGHLAPTAAREGSAG